MKGIQDQGISQCTNRARRRSRLGLRAPDPDPPGCEAQGGPGLAMTAFRPVTERPVMTKTILIEAV
jgi:hypothetical protein